MNDSSNLTPIPAADVARLIRKDLKQAFPDIKFTVRSERVSMGREGGISIQWTDGVVADKVEDVVGKYKGVFTEFDAYTDCHDPSTHVAMDDGTYYQVESIAYVREMSDATRDWISGIFLGATDTANEAEFQALLSSTSDVDALYPEAFKRRNGKGGVSDHPNYVGGVIYWAFKMWDIQPTAA